MIKTLVQMRFLQCLLLALLTVGVYCQAQDNPVIKSSVDTRDYRYFVLNNGLKALVIHDAEAEKAAAALDVYVGSADNPKARQGLAHFLEHMLFLGTEKYPNADEYQAFINANGGGHNAYTSMENTNYFFDVKAEALEPALDRFAQFFIAPLFTPEYVARERNAVHSEYTARIKNDLRRSLDAFREVVNPAHPSAKFSVGNLDTLADSQGDSVRADLLEFYQHYYSSDRMTLVVLGRESLDQLQALVTKLFSAVPKSDTSVQRDAAPLFSEGRLPLKQSVMPEKEVRSLSLLFPVPLTDPYYQQKPLEYLANLIGHEGPGSIIDVLKTKGWAEGLSAGSGFDDRFNSSFLISISLTPEGWQQRDQVVGLVFQGVNQIAADGIKKWRYLEQKQLAETAFSFQEKQDPQRTVSYLASQLQLYPVSEVYRAGFAFDEFDPELIEKYASYLNPNNLFLQETAPEVQGDTQSEFYQTPYSVKSLAGYQWAVDKELAAGLSLPERNPFIPESLDLVEVEKGSVEAPIEKSRGNTQYWFKTDTQWGVPRGELDVRLMLPNAGASPLAAAKLALYARIVQENLNAYSYPATLAGLGFSISPNTRGLDLSISGYSDKQLVLLDRILEQMSDIKNSEPVFERVKQQLMRDWRNQEKQPPYGQLFAELSVTLFSPQWSVKERLSALGEVTFEDLETFADSLFSGGQGRVLLYGNYTAKQARGVAKKVSRLMPKNRQLALQPAQVVKLKSGDKWGWLTVEHPDSALLGYLQSPGDSIEEQALAAVLQQAIGADFFNELRTEQQLGYIVFATNRKYKEVPGVVFVVQSPVASVDEIHQSMVDFFSGFTVDQEQLEQHKQAVVVDLMKKPKNLAEQAGRYWQDIVRDYTDFDYRQRLVAAVESITLEQFNQAIALHLKQQPRWLWLAAGEKSRKPESMSATTELQSNKADADQYLYP